MAPQACTSDIWLLLPVSLGEHWQGQASSSSPHVGPIVARELPTHQALPEGGGAQLWLLWDMVLYGWLCALCLPKVPMSGESCRLLSAWLILLGWNRMLTQQQPRPHFCRTQSQLRCRWERAKQRLP